MNEILNPSCSETVWRLEIDKSTKEKIIDELYDNPKEDTGINLSDEFPNGCLDDMIYILSEAKKDGRNINNTKLEFLDSQGGNTSFVEGCFEIAKRYLKGGITKEKADKLEKKSWGLENDE